MGKPEPHASLLGRAPPRPWLLAPSTDRGAERGPVYLCYTDADRVVRHVPRRRTGDLFLRWSRAIPKVLELLGEIGNLDIPASAKILPDLATEVQDLLDGNLRQALDSTTASSGADTFTFEPAALLPKRGDDVSEPDDKPLVTATEAAWLERAEEDRERNRLVAVSTTLLGGMIASGTAHTKPSMEWKTDEDWRRSRARVAILWAKTLMREADKHGS